MSNPKVNLLTATVNWTDPTTNKDGSAITQDEITGYQVGVRSTTIAGSAPNSYPILGTPVAPTTVKEALSAVTSSLKPDTYGANVRAVTANGFGDWGPEFIFDGYLPLPNGPSLVSVA